MKISTTFPLACLLFGLFFAACGKNEKGAAPRPDPDPESAPAVSEAPPAPDIPEAEEAAPAVELGEGLLEALDESVYEEGPLGQIYIDASTFENFEKCMEKLGQEIRKLPKEEQERAGKAFARYMLDTFRSYPDRQELMGSMGQSQPPSREAMEKFALYAAQPFNGKNFYDFMEDAEIRAEGRPPIEEEMKQFMDEMMQDRMQNQQF